MIGLSQACADNFLCPFPLAGLRGRRDGSELDYVLETGENECFFCRLAEKTK